MERTVIYAGSFDPVTNGHLDVIRHAAALFDRVIVLVGYNPDKHGLFTPEERLILLRRCTQDIPGITVDSWTGLTVDYARHAGACALIRGVRSAADWDAEQQLALINRHIAPEIDTVLLPAAPEYMMISSSAVRQMASFGASIKGWVPDCILPDILKRFKGA